MNSFNRSRAVPSDQPFIAVRTSSSSAASSNRHKAIEKPPWRENDPPPNTDLLFRIKGMYRLIYLYKEQSSGGLVDKTLIAQESLAGLMNRLAPRSYASLTKINFASLDNVTIQPLGIYGDKAAIVDFLYRVAGLDDETAAYLLASAEQYTSGRSMRPILTSGIYFLLPKSNPPTSDTFHGHRSFIMYWPEDTTWDDMATGAVCRNRTTFMRYLTKLTPQIRCLISRNYADTIVWKGADQELDDVSDFTDEDRDDGDAKDERFFRLKVSGVIEQEEGAELYPGFEFAHRAIVNPTLPSDVIAPDTLSDTLRARLVFGETKQGFLSARFIPPQKETKIVDTDLKQHALPSFLSRYQNIYLGNYLTEESLDILLNEGGLQQRAERLTSQWKAVTKTLSDTCHKEMNEAEVRVQIAILQARQELNHQVRMKIVEVLVRVYPLLDPQRLNGIQASSASEADPEFWNELVVKHPSVLKAESEILDPRSISHITCQKYNRIKRRILEAEKAMGSELASERDRDNALCSIIYDEIRNDGALGRLVDGYSSLGRSIKGDHSRIDPSKTTDSEFMATLHSLAELPHIRPLIDEVFDLIYNWGDQKIDELSPHLVYKIESIERQEMENQAKEQARMEEKRAKNERLQVFKQALQKILLVEPARPRLVVCSLKRRRSLGYPTYELKGSVESQKEPCIEYTLFLLELTESDKTHIQENPLFVPRPEAYGAASFKLALQDSIRHIQAIGTKILLIVDRPSGISIWLSERTRIGHDQPLKNFPASKRRYHFSVHEQRRLLAIAFIEPNGQTLLQIQAFDENFTSIQARGSPRNVTAWYQDGPPEIKHICFAGGPEELCIVEGSGRVRIYSFVSQGFRTATLRLPPDLDVLSAYSAPDDSAMIIVEQVPSAGYQLRVYHWNSFGQLPEGCILPLPENLDFRSTTEFCPSSIGQRDNVAIITIIPNQHTMRCINMQIKTKNTPYAFKSKDGKSTKVLENTMHNSFIDCHAHVWQRYPVVSAIKRRVVIKFRVVVTV
ncbi:hypothetical protein FRC02_000711 [Tulasnella sp. 418]|nr:hypothetical protein FRC02_000711 [Tulasnella sp. 418]